MKFSVIVADPPWSFSDKLKMSDVARGAEANYKTMLTMDIARLPVESWCAADTILALWVPSSLLEDGLLVMGMWGFQQKQIWSWLKTTKDGEKLAFGMGYHFRGCTEHALIGTRGKPKALNRSQRNAVCLPSMVHSQKPEALQDALELMYSGPYLELFARRIRPGWTCVGNECPSTPGQDIREWSPR